MLVRFLLMLSVVPHLLADPPPPVWELPAKLTSADLAPALAKVDESAAALPPSLVETVSFQRLLLKIHSGAPIAEWRESIAKFASSTDTAPAASGLKELARAWESRARMTEVDTALRGYYRKHVQFPAKLEDVTLPTSAQTDSWGNPWAYSPTAPKGFSAKFTSQRYTLSPSKHPQVRSIADTLTLPSPARTWKITAKEVAGQRVLEVRTSTGATIATQPGGKVEDATLLHLGNGWALFADLEKIFTLPL